MVLSIKTKYVNFSLRSRDFGNQNLLVDGIKCLGLILDEKMNWKEHMSRIKVHLNVVLRHFYFLRLICPVPVLRTIYFAIVDSEL